MGSVGNPNPWAPYDAYRDCSQQICSLYCPQWCSFSFPPPPAFSLGDDSGADFSPLIIAVIGILVSAFILVSYYTIISKFCRQRGSDNSSLEFNENRNEINGDAWQSASAGLDEAFIKSITVCKYRRGDGLVDGTDCSVCLSEFQEDESLRLLPKCNHAFHVPCIDAWLMSHASCPLCRANIAPINSVPNQAPASIQESSRSTNVSALQYPNRNDAVLVIQELETGVRQEAVVGLAWDGVPKTPNQAVHNVENGEGRDHNTIEIRPDGIQPIRRSVSLNSSLCQGRVSIADILRAGEDTDDEFQIEDLQISNGIGSSEQSGEESYKMSSRTGLYSLVRSPLAMKRSVSTGRFLFPRYDRGRNSILPN